MLYSSSVMSPFPQKSKKMSSLFASVRESKASAASGIAPGHRGSDFWSELGEMSRMSTLSTSVCAVSAGRNSSTQSTISILKVSIVRSSFLLYKSVSNCVNVFLITLLLFYYLLLGIEVATVII